MGTGCSRVSCHSECNCFLSDKNIENIKVERNAKVKWIWTDEHQSTLVTILTDPEYNYDLPLVLVDLIKMLSYSENELFYATKTELCEEPYYSKPTKLLNKKMCLTWYHSKVSNLSPFPIVIFSSETPESDCSIQSINHINRYLHGLPSHQRNSRLGCGSMKRILYINHCPFQIDVFINNINDDKTHYYIYFNQPIYLILINKNDSMITIENMCRKIWNKNNTMNNCILVTMTDVSVAELSKTLNIPSVCITSHYHHNTIQNLFRFAIKYYWFCQVAKFFGSCLNK